MRRRVLVIVCCGLGLLAPRAVAAGGPVTPVQGGAGASAPGSDVTYVAVGAGRRTVVARIRRGTGAVERHRTLSGTLGIPGVAYDGATTGLSADGRTLVLARYARGFPERRTPVLVLDARTLRVRARIALPGSSTVDAISPT